MVNLFRGGVDLRMKEIRVEKGIHMVVVMQATIVGNQSERSIFGISQSASSI